MRFIGNFDHPFQLHINNVELSIFGQSKIICRIYYIYCFSLYREKQNGFNYLNQQVGKYLFGKCIRLANKNKSDT